MEKYHVVLYWEESFGPDYPRTPERDDYFVEAENEEDAVNKAFDVLDYQTGDYPEDSEVEIYDYEALLLQHHE